MKLIWHTIAVILLSIVQLHGSHAQEYPTRPITLVMPFPPGSNADVTGRVFAHALETSIGQKVIVENRPGAAARIGAAYVNRAAPDGYTLLFYGGGVINKSFYKDVPFDFLTDMQPIVRLAKGSFFFFSYPGLNVNSLSELVELVKKNPGKYNYASVSPTQLMMVEVLKAKAGLDMVHVRYAGTTQSTLALQTGETALYPDGLMTIRPYVAQGSIKLLAVADPQRSRFAPDTPTMAELGYPEVNGYYDFAVWAPKGTPMAIVNKLNDNLNKTLQTAEVKDMLDRFTMDPVGGTPEELLKAVAKERAFWAEAAKIANYQPE